MSSYAFDIITVIVVISVIVVIVIRIDRAAKRPDATPPRRETERHRGSAILPSFSVLSDIRSAPGVDGLSSRQRRK